MPLGRWHSTNTCTCGWRAPRTSLPKHPGGKNVSSLINLLVPRKWAKLKGAFHYSMQNNGNLWSKKSWVVYLCVLGLCSKAVRNATVRSWASCWEDLGSYLGGEPKEQDCQCPTYQPKRRSLESRSVIYVRVLCHHVIYDQFARRKYMIPV